jgi:hypothetical protein
MIPCVAAAGARTLLVSSMVSLALPAAVAGQVGLSSSLGQVVLVARSAVRGSIESVGAPVERTGNAADREISVAVGVTASAPYRLSVMRYDSKDSPSGRIQVRGLSGEFQKMEAGVPILVALGPGQSGTGRLTVLYRIQPSIPSGPALAPPLRYELAIAPQL